jgi:hypothetical protein
LVDVADSYCDRLKGIPCSEFVEVQIVEAQLTDSDSSSGSPSVSASPSKLPVYIHLPTDLSLCNTADELMALVPKVARENIFWARDIHSPTLLYFKECMYFKYISESLEIIFNYNCYQMML